MHTAIVFVLLVVLIVQIDRAVIAQKPTIDTKTKTNTNAKTKMTTSITTNTPTPTMTPEATTPATAPTSATAITTTIPQWAIDIRDNPIFGMFPRMHNRSIINIWNYKTNTKEYVCARLCTCTVLQILHYSIGRNQSTRHFGMQSKQRVDGRVPAQNAHSFH
jgi:hypothetical protein